MNTAIIVAAGSGARFNSELPKQFFKIKDRSVIEWSVERFHAAPSVDSIIVVLAEEHIERFRPQLLKFPKIEKIIAGGSSRAESVRNGLAVVSADCEIVAVHDGARPLVSINDIEITLAAAQQFGAACLVGTVTDTIKSIRGGEIAATLDRDKLRRALTPQAFRTDILKQAFLTVEPDAVVTDECYLVEKIGYPITVVEGKSINIKITHREDLILAEALLEIESEQELKAGS